MKHVAAAIQPYVSRITVKRLAWYAFQSGGLKAMQYRASARSPTGASFTAHFSHYAGAQRFARRVNQFGVQVTLKASPLGQAVSVPAPRPYSRLPPSAGWLIPVRGGTRGLSRILASTGLSQVAHC